MNTEDSGAPLLELRNLSVDFRLKGGEVLHAVRGASFAIGRGETFGLVG